MMENCVFFPFSMHVSLYLQLKSWARFSGDNAYVNSVTTMRRQRLDQAIKCKGCSRSRAQRKERIQISHLLVGIGV